MGTQGMWREIWGLKWGLMKVKFGIPGPSRDPRFPLPNVILTHKISVQLQLDSLPLLNCDWLKPGEKQLAIYGSCSSWPGGITDSLEEPCFDPHPTPLALPTSSHMKTHFSEH